MPVITVPRTNRGSTVLHDGAGYAPSKIGNWVATDQRDLPWNTLAKTGSIGDALEKSVGKGQKVGHVMTAAEVMSLTGLDKLKVEKFPLYGEDGKAIPRLFATGFDDPKTKDRTYFAAVSDKYEVVNPVETFSFFDEVVNNIAGANYTAGWEMREKSMMGVTIELPQEIVVDPKGANDRTGLHLLGINSFDGSTGLLGALSATRWWCMNQLNASISGASQKFSLRHTKNVKDRADVAKSMIGTLMGYAADLDKMANGLYKAKMGDAALTRYLESLAPFALDGSESDTVKARVLERRENILEAWAAGHNENIRGTKWGAFNLVAEFAEWGRTVKGSNRTGTNPERQRAIGTLVSPHPTALVNDALAILLG